MRDIVSGWMYVVLLAASLSVVSAVFAAGFVWTGLSWLILALSVALAIASRTSPRPLRELIGDFEREPARAVARTPKAVR